MIRLSLPAFDPGHPATMLFAGVVQGHPEYEVAVAFNVRIWVDGFVKDVNLPVLTDVPPSEGLVPWRTALDMPVGVLTGGEGWFAIESVRAYPVYINDIVLDYTPAAAGVGAAEAHFS